MRKVLIATPIKTGLTATYMAGLIPTITKSFPGVQLEHCVLEGPSVNFARNEIAHYAIKIGARELLFIDGDMNWTREHVERILAHPDLDIVANIYCKRRPGPPYWLMNEKKGAEIDPVTGLCEVQDIATGFMKIRVDTVFQAIMEKFPEREFYNKPEEGKPVTAFEFFPMGVCGPRTADERMKKIKAVISEFRLGGCTADIAMNDMIEAVTIKQDPGNLRGEDYYFCELARQCGFKIYADFGAEIVPHIGDVPYPILPDMVGIDPTAALKAAGEKP